MMMRMEGRVADGCFVGCTPPEVVEPAMETVRTGLARRERPAEDFRVNTFWGWHIKADREAALRESRRELPWRARKLDPELISLYLDEDEVKIVTDNYQDYVDFYFSHSDDVKGVPKEISNKLAEGLTSTGGLDALDREIDRFKKFGGRPDRNCPAPARRADGRAEDYRRARGAGAAGRLTGSRCAAARRPPACPRQVRAL